MGVFTKSERYFPQPRYANSDLHIQKIIFLLATVDT